jgi:hypothetical protein
MTNNTTPSVDPGRLQSGLRVRTGLRVGAWAAGGPTAQIQWSMHDSAPLLLLVSTPIPRRSPGPPK